MQEIFKRFNRCCQNDLGVSKHNILLSANIYVEIYGGILHSLHVDKQHNYVDLQHNHFDTCTLHANIYVIIFTFHKKC